MLKYDERHIAKAKKESSLVSGIRPGENLFITHPPASWMCIRIYIFNLKKRKNGRETKKEKRISVKNLTRYGDFFSKFALCTFNLLDPVVNFSWLLYEFNIVYVQRGKYRICYTTSAYELHIFKDKNKRNH